MKKLIAILLLFGLTSCTKDESSSFLCNTAKAVGSGLATQIAVHADCKNLDAIKADIFDVLVKVKACSATDVKSLSIGSTLCMTAGDLLLTTITQEKFEKWECSGGQAKELILSQLSNLCSKIPF